MTTVEVTLNLPADLVARAQKAGMLTPERMITLLEKELERDYRVNRLLKTVNRLHTIKPAVAVGEIDEEIRAYRASKRTKRAKAS